MSKSLLTAVLALGLAACASLPQGKRAPGDPLERFNRSMWIFDSAVDHAVLRPAARGYVRVIPSPVRRSVHNFMTNLTYSDTIINDFLQGKFNAGTNDVARLLVNTLFGLGGLFDPATHMDLDRHDADVGQTLGVWGVPRGPYLVLPFLGPSDLRDGIGLAGDGYLEPFPYLNDQYLAWGLYLGDEFDERVQLLPEDALIDRAYDPYTFARSAYLQEREFKVHGNSTESTDAPETPEDLLGTGGGGSDNAAPATPSGPPPSGAAPPR